MGNSYQDQAAAAFQDTGSYKIPDGDYEGILWNLKWNISTNGNPQVTFEVRHKVAPVGEDLEAIQAKGESRDRMVLNQKYGFARFLKVLCLAGQDLSQLPDKSEDPQFKAFIPIINKVAEERYKIKYTVKTGKNPKYQNIYINELNGVTEKSMKEKFQGHSTPAPAPAAAAGQPSFKAPAAPAPVAKDTPPF